MAADDRIGEKLNTVRTSLGLSLEALAERSSCDVATLRKLESGEAVPSLSDLIRLTRALGVRLGTLLDDEDELGPVITRKDEARGVHRMRLPGTAGAAGVLQFFSLAAGKASRHMEPFLITAEPGGAGEDVFSSHEGEEFLHVLAGSIELRYGTATHTLSEGDSVYFDSIVPHRVRAAGTTPARVLAVVYAPA